MENQDQFTGPDEACAKLLDRRKLLRKARLAAWAVPVVLVATLPKAAEGIPPPPPTPSP